MNTKIVTFLLAIVFILASCAADHSHEEEPEEIGGSKLIFKSDEYATRSRVLRIYDAETNVTCYLSITDGSTATGHSVFTSIDCLVVSP